MANVNGNWKGGKAVVKYSRTKALGTKAKFAAQKGAGKIARNYKRYVGPSAKLARGIGKLGLGVGKTLLRFPGTGLAATGLYYGAKALVKKGERVARRSATKQWQKRDRFGRTRWYL
jgi:hypothetical protein